VTHLSRETLEQFWRDPRGYPERASVLAHLAECDDCGARYGEVMDSQPAETIRFEGDLRPAGMRAGQRTAAPVRFLSGGGPWLIGLAAAAAIVLAVGLWPRGSAPIEVDSTIRGGGLQPIAPIAQAASPIVFRWSSALSASRFRIEIRNATGETVASFESTATEAALPADVRLVVGASYRWRVTALDAQGVALTVSPDREFVVSR
jgi:hypothetical protein